MNIQKFLQDGGTIDDLKTDYFLKVNTHSRYPNLHQFKYDQIKSKFKHNLVKEARGIILDSNDDWKIISYPYDKFFNHGESHAATLNWDNVTIYEKLDGSLMVLYFYNDEWHVSSSGLPDARGQLNNIEDRILTYHDLFWEIWNKLEYKLPTDTTKCYIFELVSPINNIIVPQLQDNIILHGVRCLRTLDELCPIETTKTLGYNTVKIHDNYSLAELLTIRSKLDPGESEGFVVVDDDFKRLKIKGIAYIKLSHMSTKFKGNLKLNLLKIIIEGEGEELLSAFPKYKEEHDKMLVKYNDAVARIEASTKQHLEEYTSRKELAQRIQDLWYKNYIFAKLTNKIDDVRDWFKKQKPEYIMKNIS